MFWSIFIFISCFKLLIFPAYFSTDFEVHRNWLAITHSLPISKWYFENTSEWTLDYPPFFAYFEYVLSKIAQFVDPEMLRVSNLNYASEKTVLFQRCSVILTDVVFALGTKLCISAMEIKGEKKQIISYFLLLGNVGLLFVDHIHFQYNGFLFGILLLSIGCIIKRRYILSALLFAALLNFKHIFLYVAPVYGIFFLKFYCWQSETPLLNILKLVSVGASCLALSFSPFADHIPQVLSRLFPFKRGLTHAYWAPNFWALYNFADKIGSILFLPKGMKSPNTGGLVQEYEHSYLPSIRPSVTFILTMVFMIPCLLQLARTSNKYWQNFLRALVICSCTSFMFGWHVHEKAILMVIIPLSLLSLVDSSDAQFSFFLGIVGHYSLFPLLFKPNLFTVKCTMHLTYTLASYIGFKWIYPKFKVHFLEKLYYMGLILILAYENIFQYILHLDKKLEFLPLMLTSVYCSLGVTYFYCKYYYTFLSTEDVAVKKKTK